MTTTATQSILVLPPMPDLVIVMKLENAAVRLSIELLESV